MNRLIWLAKSGMSFVWLVLLVNVFMPYPGKAAIVFYILTAFLFMMHLLQLLIFLGAFGDKIKLTGKEKVAVLFFGTFQLLSIRRKYLSSNNGEITDP